MIRPFVNEFMVKTPSIKEDLAINYPGGYSDLVMRLIRVLSSVDDAGFRPDPDRITCIDHGDSWKGTALYIIGAQGYQPSVFWSIFVVYGSCLGCDTYEAIKNYSCDEKLTSRQIDDYWTLMLHMVQSMRLVR